MALANVPIVSGTYKLTLKGYNNPAEFTCAMDGTPAWTLLQSFSSPGTSFAPGYNAKYGLALAGGNGALVPINGSATADGAEGGILYALADLNKPSFVLRTLAPNTVWNFGQAVGLYLGSETIGNLKLVAGGGGSNCYNTNSCYGGAGWGGGGHGALNYKLTAASFSNLESTSGVNGFKQNAVKIVCTLSGGGYYCYNPGKGVLGAGDGAEHSGYNLPAPDGGIYGGKGGKGYLKDYYRAGGGGGGSGYCDTSIFSCTENLPAAASLLPRGSGPAVVVALIDLLN